MRPNHDKGIKAAWHSLQNNKDLVLKSYDKGRGIAIMSREDYLHEGYRQLSNREHYMKLEYDNTKETADMLQELVGEMYRAKQIDLALAEYLDPYDSQQLRTPVFFMLPKIHKRISPHVNTKCICRPVTSGCGTPLEKASELIDFYLLPEVRKQPSFLKDTGDTIRKIESTVLPQDVILASLDIVSMFTSISQEEAFSVAMETLASVNPFDYDPMMPDLKYMGELLRIVLYRNSFEFNNEFFAQISGVPMGQRSSPSICNLVVHILEKKILNLSPHIHTLFRFMDDTLVFFTASIQELEDLVKTANTLHPTLKITHEVSTETIQFLDLVIYKGERFKSTGILDIKCHTKKTETGQYLHRTSSHPESVFRGFLKGECTRIARNNSCNDTFKEKQSFFTEKLETRGYTDQDLENAKKSVSFKDRHLFIREKPKSTEIPLVFKTTYYPHIRGKSLRQAILKHWPKIGDDPKLKTIFPKPPMIAFSRTKSLRDSLVVAKLPHLESEGKTMSDFFKNDISPPCSPTLQMLQELEIESRGFNEDFIIVSESEDNEEHEEDGIFSGRDREHQSK